VGAGVARHGRGRRGDADPGTRSRFRGAHSPRASSPRRRRPKSPGRAGGPSINPQALDLRRAVARSGAAGSRRRACGAVTGSPASAAAPAALSLQGMTPVGAGVARHGRGRRGDADPGTRSRFRGAHSPRASSPRRRRPSALGRAGGLSIKPQPLDLRRAVARSGAAGSRRRACGAVTGSPASAAAPAALSLQGMTVVVAGAAHRWRHRDTGAGAAQR
jgi:hypothetical protein